MKGDTLELNNVHRTDMGKYLCIAKNNVPPSISKEFNVQIHCEFRVKINVLTGGLTLNAKFARTAHTRVCCTHSYGPVFAYGIYRKTTLDFARKRQPHSWAAGPRENPLRVLIRFLCARLCARVCVFMCARVCVIA